MKINRKLSGFTIIEVLIVLAIAGLIISIVFLAVPQLQRSSRNTQRQADASRISSAVNECLSNNNGDITQCMPAAGNINSGSSPTGPILGAGGYMDMTKNLQLTTVILYSGTSATQLGSTTTATVYGGNICSGNAPTTAGAGTNSYVVLYYKETGRVSTTAACLSP